MSKYGRLLFVIFPYAQLVFEREVVPPSHKAELTTFTMLSAMQVPRRILGENCHLSVPWGAD